MLAGLKLFITILVIGLVSLYRDHAKSQSHFVQLPAEKTTSVNQLPVDSYFYKDKNESIKRWGKYHTVLELNICAKLDKIQNFMPDTWKVIKREEPSNDFKCSAVAVSYSVVSTEIKNLVDVLDKAGLKIQYFQDITCADELKMRKQIFQDLTSTENLRAFQIGLKMIRMAFHDSVDYENIMSAKKLDGKVDYEGPQGLDFCLHTTLNRRRLAKTKDILDEDPGGNGNHNRGLQKPKQYVEKLVKKNPMWTKPDVLVLGAIIAAGAVFKGPQIPFKMGRRVGDCEMVFCSRHGCNQSQNYFLINQPDPKAQDPKQNLDFFKSMGYSLEQAVALMGAHSIGGVNVCTGNGNPGNQAWCEDAPKIPKKRLNNLQTYFDTTAGEFDNQYFKELTEYFSQDAPTCKEIGEQKQKKDRKGRIVREAKDQQYCEEPVCDAGGKIRYTNKVSKGYGDREIRKVAYLPADWAMMKDEDAARIEREYAQDRAKFWKVFAQAYEKVLSTGYDKDELLSCKSVECSLSGDNFDCEGIKFAKGGEDCNPVGANDCKLIGGHGIKGVIQCDGEKSFKCDLA